MELYDGFDGYDTFNQLSYFPDSYFYGLCGIYNTIWMTGLTGLTGLVDPRPRVDPLCVYLIKIKKLSLARACVSIRYGVGVNGHPKTDFS